VVLWGQIWVHSKAQSPSFPTVPDLTRLDHWRPSNARRRVYLVETFIFGIPNSEPNKLGAHTVWPKRMVVRVRQLGSVSDSAASRLAKDRMLAPQLENRKFRVLRNSDFSSFFRFCQVKSDRIGSNMDSLESAESQLSNGPGFNSIRPLADDLWTKIRKLPFFEVWPDRPCFRADFSTWVYQISEILVPSLFSKLKPQHRPIKKFWPRGLYLSQVCRLHGRALKFAQLCATFSLNLNQNCEISRVLKQRYLT